MFIINITSLWYTVCINYYIDLQQLQTDEILLFSINPDDEFPTY